METSLFSNDEIQQMIKECNQDEALKQMILADISEKDRGAVSRVLHVGYFEEFDKYDSDVCEQFIRAYEDAKSKTEIETEKDL